MGEKGEVGVDTIGGANVGATVGASGGTGIGIAGAGADVELLRVRLNDHDRRRPPSSLRCEALLPSPMLSRRFNQLPNNDAIGDAERVDPHRVELVDDSVRVRELSGIGSGCGSTAAVGADTIEAI
jgi:hypothetical protein